MRLATHKVNFPPRTVPSRADVGIGPYTVTRTMSCPLFSLLDSKS